MADDKVFYWLKLKEDFFEDDTIRWLEEQENGKEYTLFYLKLCLKSLNLDGKIIRIVGEKLIPYDKKALAKLTNTDIDTVTIAMNLFTQIGLIDILNTGEIYMKQVKEMVGSKTEGALRKAKYRKGLEEGEWDNVPRLSQECPTEYRDKSKEIRVDEALRGNDDVTSGNEVKKKTTRNSAKAKYDEASPYYLLAKELFARIKQNNDEAKEPNYQSWADEFRKLIELDGKSVDNVRLVIQWSQQDSFWKSNILSAKKLREKYDQLKVQCGKFESKTTNDEYEYF